MAEITDLPVFTGADEQVSGGTHHDAAPAAPAPVFTGDPAQDQQQQRPSLLNTAWKTIQGGAQELWHEAGGLVHSFINQDPGADEAAAAGVSRGVRNVTDKLQEGNALFGGTDAAGGIIPYVPGQGADFTKVQQQNAADRAAYNKQWSGNRVADFWQTVGGGLATAPVTVPLTMATGGLADAFIPGIAARGLPGIAARGAERLLSGTLGGGTQAALTSDPSQPFWPQVGAGAFIGGVLGPTVGAVGDVGSNAVRRLSGQTVPQDPYLSGTVPQTTQERAAQAQYLLGEGVNVPLRLVSPDPVVQTSATVGRLLPGSGLAAEDAQLGGQFRNAALRNVVPGTPSQVVSDNFRTQADAHIQSLYDNSVRAVPSVPSIMPGPGGNTLSNDLSIIRTGVPRSLDPTYRGQIDDAIDHINDVFAQGRGAISGADYQTLTNRSTGALAPLLNSDDATVRAIGRQIGTQLDQRLRSQMTNDQSTMYDNANARYRAWQDIKDAAKSDGTFTPADLLTQTDKTRETYGGAGSLDRLAQTGTTVLQKTLESGKTGLATQAATAAGTAVPTAAIMAALKGLSLASLADVSGTSLLGTGGLLYGNRLLQGTGQAAGPRAVNAALTGGGPSVAELRAALAALRIPAVSASQQQQQ